LGSWLHAIGVITFLPMNTCKNCKLDVWASGLSPKYSKAKPYSHSSLTTSPHQEFLYDSAQRVTHWERPEIFHNVISQRCILDTLLMWHYIKWWKILMYLDTTLVWSHRKNTLLAQSHACMSPKSLNVDINP
jgi:hypothetical protein